MIVAEIFSAGLYRAAAAGPKNTDNMIGLILNLKSEDIC